MSVTTRLKLVSIAEVVFAVELVIAVILGAPTWAIAVLAVLSADAAAYGLWQLRVTRGTASSSRTTPLGHPPMDDPLMPGRSPS